jgi:hypothetical protein
MVTKDGRTFVGSYTVHRGVVHVTYGDAAKSTHVGTLGAERLARLLLLELVHEAETSD